MVCPSPRTRARLSRACLLTSLSLSYGTTALAGVDATWANAASGTWSNPSRWSTNPLFPNGPADNAYFTPTASPHTVTLNSDVTLHNLTVTDPNAILFQTGGVLAAGGTMSFSTGTYRLGGGTLSNTTLSSSGTASLSVNPGYVSLTDAVPSPVFDHVTLDGNLALSNSNPNVSPALVVRNGLTLTPNHSITGDPLTASILFDGAQTLAGTGTLTNVSLLNQGGPLTLDAGVTLAATSPSTTLTLGSGTAPVTNAGSITVTDGHLNAYSLTNLGTISVNSVHTDGNQFASATIADLDNRGTLIVNPSNTRLTGNWHNTVGYIYAGGANFICDGTFTTADLAHVVVNGGMTIAGTLDNTGTVFDFNGAQLEGYGYMPLGPTGVIKGGTVRSGYAGKLVISWLYSPLGAGTFDDVTLDSDLSINALRDFHLAHTLTLVNRTISLDGDGSSLVLDSAPTTLAGTGQVLFNVASPVTATPIIRGNTVIGPGIAVRTAAGSGIIGSPLGTTPTSTLLNQGIISAETPGKTLLINAANWVNQGTLQATNNATLQLAGTVRTADLGTLVTSNGGQVVLSAALDNTGSTFTVTASLVLDSSASITGGTLASTLGGGVSVNGSGPTLDSVTLDTDLTIPENATLNARNGLTLANGHHVTLAGTTGSGDRVLDVAGGGTLAGSGQVVFDAAAGGSGYIRSTGGNLTIAPAITVRTGTGDGFVGAPAADLLNQGSIVADTPNHAITIDGNQVRNEGLLRAGPSSTLTLRGNWTNAGSIQVDGGVLQLDGSFTPDSLGSFTVTDTPGAEIRLTGTLDNTGRTTSLSQFPGPWKLYGGRIRGGTVVGPVSFPASTAGVAPAGTLDGVTLAGAVTVPSYITLNAENGLTLAQDANLTLAPSPASPASLQTVGTQTIAGPGQIVLNGTAAAANATLYPSSGTLTLGPDLTVRTAGPGSLVIGNSSLPLSNYAAVSAQVPNSSITLQGGPLTNYGTIEARDGGSVTLAGSWTNPGTLRAANGGTLNLSGTFTTSDLGSWNGAAGNVVVQAGTLDNTGAILTLSAATGPLNLGSGGTLKGGTLTSTDGTPLVALSASSAINAVTLQTDVVVRDGATLNLLSNLSAAGRTFSLASTGSTTSLKTPPGVSLPAGATISFDGTAAANFVTGVSTFSPFIIPAGTTVRTGSGSGVVGAPTIPLTNSGTISAQTPGQSLTFAGASWVNLGTLAATNSSTLNLAGSFTPASIGTLSVTSGGIAQITGLLTVSSASPVSLSSSLPLSLGPSGQISGTGAINSPDSTPLVVRGAGARVTSATVNIPVSVLAGAGVTFSSAALNQPVTVTGGTVSLTGAWANKSSVTATANSTISLSTPIPSSFGSYTLTDSTLSLNGTGYTTARIKPISFTTSKITIPASSSLDNTGDSLALSPSTATLTLASGTLKGGTVTGPAGAPVLFSSTATTSTLDGVTLAADANVVANSTLTFTNGLTLSGGANISLATSSLTSTAVLLSSITQTLGGTGTVSFDGAAGTPSLRPSSGTLTLGPSLTIRTGTNSGSVGTSTLPLVNQGTISAQTPGTKIAVSALSLTNSGTLSASNSATLTLSPLSFTNTGRITVDATSTFYVSGSVANSPAALGAVQLAGTAVINYPAISPVNALRQQFLLGLTSSPQGSAGISLPTDPSNPARALAYIEAADFLHLTGTQTATFHGLTVDATTLLLFPTLAGDANADGSITPDDYALLDRAYAKSLASPHWTDGDFNYDGQVTTADYLLIDRSFALTHGGLSPDLIASREAQFGPEYVESLVQSVPEPAFIASLWPIAALASRRRRRQT